MDSYISAALEELYLDMNMSAFDNQNFHEDFITKYRPLYKESIFKVLKVLNNNVDKLEKINYDNVYDNGGWHYPIPEPEIVITINDRDCIDGYDYYFFIEELGDLGIRCSVIPKDDTVLNNLLLPLNLIYLKTQAVV